MSNREKVTRILKEIKPTKNLEGIENIVEGGYIDSFELMELISKLSDEFGVEILVEDITLENFNSIDSISSMIDKLVSNK